MGGLLKAWYAMANLPSCTSSHNIGPLTEPEWYVIFARKPDEIESEPSNRAGAERQSDDVQLIVATHWI